MGEQMILLGDTRIRLSNIKNYGIARGQKEQIPETYMAPVWDWKVVEEEKEIAKGLFKKKSKKVKVKGISWTTTGKFVPLPQEVATQRGCLVRCPRIVFCKKGELCRPLSEAGLFNQKTMIASEDGYYFFAGYPADIVAEIDFNLARRLKVGDGVPMYEYHSVWLDDFIDSCTIVHERALPDYLYITTFQGDNFRFFVDSAPFDIYEKAKAIDQAMDLI